MVNKVRRDNAAFDIFDGLFRAQDQGYWHRPDSTSQAPRLLKFGRISL
jgi:hypothetical protein